MSTADSLSGAHGYRIVVVGDQGCGKTSLIQSLVSTTFSDSAPPLIDRPVLFPASRSSLALPVPCYVLDTAAAPSGPLAVSRESLLRTAHAVCIVLDASRPETWESAETRWLPEVRAARQRQQVGGGGVVSRAVPVVVVANKVDLVAEQRASGELVAALNGVLDRNRDVESCLTCSARQLLYVSEVFDLAQKAVVFPTVPLYDVATGRMTDKCVAALSRVFRLLDRDGDGALSDDELNRFQQISSGPPDSASGSVGPRPLSADELDAIKAKVRRDQQEGLTDRGYVALPGFLYLNHRLCQRAKVECTWRVLYSFGYDTSLELSDSFLNPPLPRLPAGRRYELGASGVGFLADLFQRHDADGDGKLSEEELASLFATAPNGLHPFGNGFPETTAVTEPLSPSSLSPSLALRGFIAQFRMLCLVDCRLLLRYFAYLGFDGDLREALSVAADPPRPSSHPAFKATAAAVREDAASGALPPPPRSVFMVYVFGSRGCGKTALMRCFVGKRFEPEYAPTTETMRVCNGVNDDVYLSLCEFVNDDDVVHDAELMAKCDACCVLHDVHNPSSFAHAMRLHTHILERFPWVPCVHVASKSDLPAVHQIAVHSPNVFLRTHGLPSPIAVSVRDGVTSDLFFTLARACSSPKGFMPTRWGLMRAWPKEIASGAAMMGTWQKAVTIGISLAVASVGSTALVAYVVNRWRGGSKTLTQLFSWICRVFPGLPL